MEAMASETKEKGLCNLARSLILSVYKVSVNRKISMQTLSYKHYTTNSNVGGLFMGKMTGKMTPPQLSFTNNSTFFF